MKTLILTLSLGLLACANNGASNKKGNNRDSNSNAGASVPSSFAGSSGTPYPAFCPALDHTLDQVGLDMASSVQQPSACGLDYPAVRHKNPDGTIGGFVALGAHVDDSAFVGFYASVCDSAQVLGNAKIQDQAMIFDSVIVKDQANVYGCAQVLGNAQVSGNASVFDNVDICAWVDPDSCNPQITGSARVHGENTSIIGSWEQPITKDVASDMGTSN